MSTFYSTKKITVVGDEIREGISGKVIQYQDGYKSWCPDGVFRRDYQPVTALSFGHALAALKDGKRVARSGWNGKGMWLAYVAGTDWTCRIDGPDHDECKLPWIAMKTADNGLVPWLASQTDVLADDWCVIE